MSREKFEEYSLILQNFGLTPAESKVYLALLKKGSKGDIIGRLYKELDIKRPTIYKLVNQLIEKGWLLKGDFSDSFKKAQLFIARKPFVVLNERIEKKVKKLEVLREQSVLIGDHLEKIYDKKRNLLLGEIHRDTVKYIEPLINNKWKVFSEVIEYSESLRRKVFDYELRSPNCRRKMPETDAGLIIFDYSYKVENDVNLVESALNMLRGKSEYDMKHNPQSPIKNVKFIKTSIRSYFGSIILVKFKEGSPTAKFLGEDWVEIGKHIAIPIRYKIILLWAETEPFEFLMNTILKVD